MVDILTIKCSFCLDGRYFGYENWNARWHVSSTCKGEEKRYSVEKSQIKFSIKNIRNPNSGPDNNV